MPKKEEKQYKLLQDKRIIVAVVIILLGAFFVITQLSFLWEETEEKLPPPLKTTTTTLPQQISIEIKENESIKLGENGYKLLMEKPENIYEKTVTLIDVLANGAIILDVNGERKTFPTTKMMGIMDGLIITYIKASYGVQKSDKTAILTIEELNLGPNEYLLNAGQTAKFWDKLIKLENVGLDGTIYVKVGPKEIRIEPKAKGTVGAYTVTNLLSFYSDRKGERTALIKVETPY